MVAMDQIFGKVDQEWIFWMWGVVLEIVWQRWRLPTVAMCMMQFVKQVMVVGHRALLLQMLMPWCLLVLPKLLLKLPWQLKEEDLPL